MLNMQIQVNRKDFIEISNIKKIVEKNGKVYVYKKTGYPHAIIAECSKISLLTRIANKGVNSNEIKKYLF